MSGTRAPRRAWVAIFAVLFQAILFGWHHHDPIVPSHLPAAVVENPPASAQAVDDEDSCEICQTLHHLFAAPVDFAGSLASQSTAADRCASEPTLAARPLALAFRARAPPPFA